MASDWLGLGHMLIFGPINCVSRILASLKEEYSLECQVGVERCPVGWQEARVTGGSGGAGTLGP